MEYILYTDESDQKGKFYSNFYGGALVRSTDLLVIEEMLNQRKTDLNLFREIKWTKVTETYLDKYIAFMETFFDLIEQDRIKVRLMFTKESNVAVGLTEDQLDNGFFYLYYQFLKHAFGLVYSNAGGDEITLRILLDQLPDSRERASQFKGYVYGLRENKQYRAAKLRIPDSAIGEIRSHDHVILQGLDVILGGVCSRLNNKHLEKPVGQHFRGKKTIAKEKLYKYMNSRIRKIYPGFNVGITTGKKNWDDLWKHPYRHWLFTPNECVKDEQKNKPR